MARLWSHGYGCDEVDAFLESVTEATAHQPPAMAPYEVDDVRFRGIRWGRGYQMRAVDERLDEMRTSLQDRHGHDAVHDVTGHAVERQRRIARWIYLTAAVVVVVLLALVAYTAL